MWASLDPLARLRVRGHCGGGEQSQAVCGAARAGYLQYRATFQRMSRFESVNHESTHLRKTAILLVLSSSSSSVPKIARESFSLSTSTCFPPTSIFPPLAASA